MLPDCRGDESVLTSTLQLSTEAAHECQDTTKPEQVIKTRLQLQGELQARAAASGTVPPPPVYRSLWSAPATIVRLEGWRGLQRGLAPAYLYQVMMNGTRLGFYEQAKGAYAAAAEAWQPTGGAGASGTRTFATAVAAGATTGVLGTWVSSPLFMLKTRMQSFTRAKTAAGVGTQHAYVSRGLVGAWLWVWRHNGGLRGLYKGVGAASLRTGVGSATQLATYDAWKEGLAALPLFAPGDGDGGGAHPALLHLAASLATSLAVVVVMNPLDVLMTRVYNQGVDARGRGLRYRGAWDCLRQTLRTEGPGALAKGFGAHYLRVGPHTVLTFVFLEQVRSWADEHVPAAWFA